MAIVKTFPGGAKQAPMPGPKSAAYKKIVAASKAAKKSGSGKKKGTGKKHPKSNTAFGSLKSRQAVVEKAKREIWASMLKINESIIDLAKAGNFGAAKALFDFAGVYSLPEPEDEGAAVTAPTAGAQGADAVAQPQEDPVDAFFRSIGIAREAEPEAVGASK